MKGVSNTSCKEDKLKWCHVIMALCMGLVPDRFLMDALAIFMVASTIFV